MRKLLIGLVLLTAGRAALACDDTMDSSYSPPENPLVDKVAIALAVVPMMSVLGICDIVMTPADIYWKIERPQDAYGAHVAIPICSPAAGKIWRSSRFVADIPDYTGIEPGPLRSNRLRNISSTVASAALATLAGGVLGQ